MIIPDIWFKKILCSNSNEFTVQIRLHLLRICLREYAALMWLEYPLVNSFECHDNKFRSYIMHIYRISI